MNSVTSDHDLPLIEPKQFTTAEAFLAAIQSRYPDAFAGKWGRETKEKLRAIWHLQHKENIDEQEEAV